jgi:hypothetical protein
MCSARSWAKLCLSQHNVFSNVLAPNKWSGVERPQVAVLIFNVGPASDLLIQPRPRRKLVPVGSARFPHEYFQELDMSMFNQPFLGFALPKLTFITLGLHCRHALLNI